MGLLDEAIREHLELKRRRGADPSEIARAERDALEPVFPGERPRGGEPALEEGEPTMPVEHAPDGAGDLEPTLATDGAVDLEPTPAPDDGGDYASAPAPDPGFSTLGQETAELDMEAYMDGVDAVAADGAVAGEAAHLAAEAPGVIGDEMLDWEEPQSAHREPPPEQIPGQERLSLE
jgi:hypothetical protein